MKDSKKIEEIVNCMVGLRKHEWLKVKAAIDKTYDSATIQVQLSDEESLRRHLELEFIGKIKGVVCL